MSMNKSLIFLLPPESFILSPDLLFLTTIPPFILLKSNQLHDLSDLLLLYLFILTTCVSIIVPISLTLINPLLGIL